MNVVLQQEIPYANKVYAVYPYGSRVYGNFRPDSDWDYLLILPGIVPTEQIIKKRLSFTIQSKDKFQEALNNHEMWALECYFLPDNKIEKKPLKQWDFKLNIAQLKQTIGDKIADCFLKAEKKINIDNLLIGKKNLFHALRIALFGLQIIKYGKIIDYSEANIFWKAIYNLESRKWEDYEKVFGPIYNKLKEWFFMSKVQENVSSLYTFLPKKSFMIKQRIYQDKSR